jgi:hypothetical protein
MGEVYRATDTRLKRDGAQFRQRMTIVVNWVEELKQRVPRN